ncbi:MAG: His/Gly/Thr/Pro-type tRNA ligase C-terminal domain-containing protein, partial [Verrucomicrobiota bacterium]
AYYTGFVFEAFEREGENRALAGGGRYDHLIKKVGGPEMPAAGFAIGDVTLALCLESKNRLPPLIQKPDVYCVIGGADERGAALRDLGQLRRAGFVADYSLKELGFSKQFKQANERGASLCLIYGSEELAAQQVTLKDLQSGNERKIPRREILSAVSDALENGIAAESE